jgi:hypothetical protein
MSRKYLFWGLLVMLLAVLVYMIMQSREMEKQQAAAAIGVVKSAQSTPTRAYSPQDLEIVDAAMDLSPAAPGAQEGRSHAATHELTIRNNGKVPYENILLDITYRGGDGKTLYTKTYMVADKIVVPGQSVSLSGIRIEGVPGGVKQSSIRIVYAEIAGSAPAGESAPKEER